MYERPQIRAVSNEPDQHELLHKVERFLEDLARDLENDICSHVLAENMKEAERINRHLVGTQKILSTLKGD